ncbi:hypothetical protein ACQ4PT_039250 [Festuca glaucescens]
MAGPPSPRLLAAVCRPFRLASATAEKDPHYRFIECHYEEEEEEEELDGPAAAAIEQGKVQSVYWRLLSEPVGIHVHEVIIRGNAKTREELIEAEVADILRSASILHDLLGVASIASGRLRRFGVFDAVNITLDAGPPELPGTTNVVIQVVEAASPVTRRAGVFSKTEVRSPIGSICWRLQDVVGRELEQHLFLD